MQKKVIHEHKLSKPLTIILGIFAFGVVMNAVDMYLISDALAQALSGSLTVSVAQDGDWSILQY